MRSMRKLAAFASFVILFSSSAFAATVTGTVKGPDGAPFEGAFVQAAGETFGPGDCPVRWRHCSLTRKLRGYFQRK